MGWEENRKKIQGEKESHSLVSWETGIVELVSDGKREGLVKGKKVEVKESGSLEESKGVSKEGLMEIDVVSLSQETVRVGIKEIYQNVLK